ncbi:MAG: MotA/TolQ/ExbB proton channel family protein [Candidatus Hydrogenedentales bacterium]|jgi:chemotaxis protein MotA
MDIATLAGFIAGWGIFLVAVLMGGTPAIYLDLASFLIVGGGTLSSTLINYPLRDVLSVFRTLRIAFFHKDQTPEILIRTLVSFATIARREGILALEGYVENSEDEFLTRSVRLAIDGSSPELIKDILSTELAFLESRHALGQSMLLSMGAYAPAFGMIGTLIGLVQMLAEMDDPSKIGIGMSVALTTTLYGALLANVFFLPAAGKLKVRTANELLQKEIIIEGILSIQSGDNPRIVEQKLLSFVAPSFRNQVQVKRHYDTGE